MEIEEDKAHRAKKPKHANGQLHSSSGTQLFSSLLLYHAVLVYCTTHKSLHFTIANFALHQLYQSILFHLNDILELISSR